MTNTVEGSTFVDLFHISVNAAIFHRIKIIEFDKYETKFRRMCTLSSSHKHSTKWIIQTLSLITYENFILT